MARTYSLDHLSDDALLRDLSALVTRERTTTAELLAHVAEVDARRLYLPAGYPCSPEIRSAGHDRTEHPRQAALCRGVAQPSAPLGGRRAGARQGARRADRPAGEAQVRCHPQAAPAARDGEQASHPGPRETR